jgi:pimeloyl-ACP methyl ester carboxylesterase
MPNVYLSDQRIPELDGVSRGAATVIVHEPNDVEALQSLCLLSGIPVEDPTAGIFHALASYSTAPSAVVDVQAWNVKRQRLRIEPRNWQSIESDEFLNDETQQIITALGFAREVWSNQGPDVSNLSLLFSVPDPANGKDRHVELQGGNPGWMLYRGSLRARLFMGAFKTSGFVIAILSKQGIGVQLRADRVAEELRSRQLEHLPRVEPLQSLHEGKVEDFADKCGVIIFLHGLVSTDLGTFDVLLRHLRDEGQLDEEHFAFVGWSHDTLTRIDHNARELCAQMEKLFPQRDDGEPKIAFVCHSRGGLLARYAAAKLFAQDQERWEQRIAGCVTFGTPHLGTGLADAPDELVAWSLALQSCRVSGQLPLLSHVLWVAKQNKTLEGVEDLRELRGRLPKKRSDSFQATLNDLERRLDPKIERKLDILAIGSRVDKKSKWYYELAAGALGNADNDVLVPLDSSRPKNAFNIATCETTCDHFSYFTEGQAKQKHYKTVSDYLRKVLEWNRCVVRTEGPVKLMQPLFP